MSAELHFMEGK